MASADPASTSAAAVASEGMIADKMRVLFVNTPTLPPLGADTWVHSQILRDLDRSTHELYAACSAGPPGARTPTFRVFSKMSDICLRPVDLGPELFGRSRSDRRRALLATLRAIPSLAGLTAFARRQRVQVIHTSDRPRDAFACVLLARLTGAKCLVHVHVGYGEWMSPLLKWSLKRADALIAVSEFVRRSLISSGYSSANIHVVLNAIDPAAWSPREGRDEARRELGVPPGAPVVLTVCRLFPAKGPADLIRALPALRDEYPDLRLVIVGEEMQAGFKKQLEDIACNVGVAAQVDFMGRRSDIARMMAAADIFAMPSFEEPFGLVFLEAMAMELPVVALDSGGTSEVVSHGVNGLLSKPGDIRTLGENLLQLIRDPSLRARMGACGRRQVQLHFTTSRMAGDTALVYKRLVSGQASGSNPGRREDERVVG